MSTLLEVTQQDSNANAHTSKRYIRDGIAGNFQAVAQVVRMVRKAANDKGIASFTYSDILAPQNLDSNSDPESIFQAIFNYVKATVKYVNDPAGEMESLKDARTSLIDGYGDCDDYATLIASLLASIGFDPAIVLAKYDNDTDSPFGHMYVIANANDKRYVFDPVIPNGKFNDEIQPLESKEIPVFGSHVGIDSIGAKAFNIAQSVKDSVHHIAQLSKNVLPFAASVIPQLAPASAVSSLIPSKEMSSSGSNFQQTAKQINTELNGHIRTLAQGDGSAWAAKRSISNAQQTINNVTPDTDNEKIIKSAIQNKIDLINSVDRSEFSHDALIFGALAVTSAVAIYAYRKEIFNYHV